MTTKKITLFAIMAFFIASMPLLAQGITAPRAASPAAEVTQTIGISKVTLPKVIIRKHSSTSILP